MFRGVRELQGGLGFSKRSRMKCGTARHSMCMIESTFLFFSFYFPLSHVAKLILTRGVVRVNKGMDFGIAELNYLVNCICDWGSC